jgi:hypothetical protein
LRKNKIILNSYKTLDLLLHARGWYGTMPRTACSGSMPVKKSMKSTAMFRTAGRAQTAVLLCRGGARQALSVPVFPDFWELVAGTQKSLLEGQYEAPFAFSGQK